MRAKLIAEKGKNVYFNCIVGNTYFKIEKSPTTFSITNFNQS